MRGTPEHVPLSAISHFEQADLSNVLSLEVITIIGVFDHPDIKQVLSLCISYYETKSLTVPSGPYEKNTGCVSVNPGKVANALI